MVRLPIARGGIRDEVAALAAATRVMGLSAEPAYALV